MFLNIPQDFGSFPSDLIRAKGSGRTVSNSPSAKAASFISVGNIGFLYVEFCLAYVFRVLLVVPLIEIGDTGAKPFNWKLYSSTFLVVVHAKSR